MRKVIVTGLAVVFGLVAWGALALAGEEKIPIDKLPKAVLDAAKAKFPGALVREATKEEEDGKVTYEVLLTVKGRKIDLALKPDGTILEVEKEIEASELPKAVAEALAAKYPGATVKKAEEATAGEKVTYEVVVETADKKTHSLAFDKQGKVLEDEAG